MAGRVYIHELVDIVGTNRSRYLQHVTANWGPVGRAERRQRCFGVWGVVGSTGRWPQVVNLWEYDSWADLAHNFEVELSSPSMQDPSLAEWWEVAADLRSGGTDRILVGAEWSPGVEELCAEGPLDGVACLHELVRCPPGGAPALLDAVEELGRSAYAELGLRSIGGFRRAMCADDEVVLLWSVPSWPGWASLEAAWLDPSSTVGEWRRSVAPLVVGWERTLLADAPLSPLRTGQQPRVEDRRPLDQV